MRNVFPIGYPYSLNFPQRIGYAFFGLSRGCKMCYTDEYRKISDPNSCQGSLRNFFKVIITARRGSSANHLQVKIVRNFVFCTWICII